MKEEGYYYYAQQLEKYERLKKRQGSNYVIECYIEKYQALVDECTQLKPKGHPELKEKYVCTPGEWEEVMAKRIKQLKRKIKSHKATWVDHMLYDLYTGEDIHKKVYFKFEEE